MKCLSVLQPYASLIALAGHPDPEVRRLAKKFETRSWPTKYRGTLAIHASKGFPKWARELCGQDPFKSALAKAKYETCSKLPLGAIVAICRLVDCRLITADNAPPEPERSFGDYTPGRFAWILEDVKSLPEPVPVKGMLGLWEWTPPEGVIIDGQQQN